MQNQIVESEFEPKVLSDSSFSAFWLFHNRAVPKSSRQYSHYLYFYQSILKEISPGISLEGMMLTLKLQYFGHLMQRVDSLDWGQEEKGMTEDEMAGWHH